MLVCGYPARCCEQRHRPVVEAAKEREVVENGCLLGHDAEEPIRISNLPINQREKAYNKLKRKTDVPSCTAPMWRDVSDVFDEISTNGMFEQIFESMMEEHDGCDVEEYELMVEQFNLFAGRVAPTMIELMTAGSVFVTGCP